MSEVDRCAENGEDGRENEGTATFSFAFLIFRPSSPFFARLCLSLAPVPQLLCTRKERDCVQPKVALAIVEAKIHISFKLRICVETSSSPSTHLWRIMAMRLQESVFMLFQDY